MDHQPTIDGIMNLPAYQPTITSPPAYQLTNYIECDFFRNIQKIVYLLFLAGLRVCDILNDMISNELQTITQYQSSMRRISERIGQLWEYRSLGQLIQRHLGGKCCDISEL